MINGESGFLVKEGDSDDLIKKISSLQDDNDLAKSMGEKGKKFIQKEFSLSVSAQNFLRIIEPYV